MRFPRLRFWMLMAGVGLVAFAVLIVLWQRAKDYHLAAERYSEYAWGYDSSESFEDRGFTSCYGGRWDVYSDQVASDVRTHNRDRKYRQAKAAYYRQLSQKYERAALSPWLPVAPAAQP